ncbi:MAG: hypothetical protein COT16_03095 [Elusimicrobia bacterium CG08_land_8_20_14_0_20_44_26]|nr:MAG: hypothetical protein COT16_03095 [Elusimicrobia bacterium CG08_land_8_20_14_0_20_44_26]
MLILKGKDVISADRKKIKSGTSGWVLIRRAGAALASFLTTLDAKKILFVTGRGNNGADGVVAAGALGKNIEKKIVCLFSRKEVNDNYLRAAKVVSGEIIYAPNALRLKKSVREADCVVDCIFGTGFHGRVSGFLGEAIRIINDAGTSVVSCDVPSGIDSDTGEYDCAVKARFTVTFGFPKLGLFLNPARNFAGSVRAVDIGLKKPRLKTSLNMITAGEIRKNIPERGIKSHKYTSGLVLIFAGKMKGAARLVALGALRAGCGLITFVTDDKINMPEAIEINYGADLKKYIKEKKVKAVVFGPGLGRDLTEEKRNVLKVLSKTAVPKVIDADGIFIVKKAGFEGKLKNCVFTPHTGEAKILTSSALDPPGVWKTAQRLARKLNSVIVLKGHQTVISDGEKVWINPSGNPVLATGGTGDALAGMTALFLAQGARPLEAAKSAVHIHGLAADIFLKKKGDRGALVTEIVSFVPRVMRKIIERKPV